MELDDMRTAWRALTQELSAQRQLNLALLKENRLDSTRRTLRPLHWGQRVQIICGVALAVIAAPFWLSHLGEPHLVTVGVISHLYALTLIITGARTLRQLGRLDFGVPVVEIQAQIARLEQIHVQNGWLVGLPWWLVWLPISLLGLGLFGVDVYADVPRGWILYSVGFGVIGASVTVLVYRWAINSAVPARAARARELAAGKDFARAQAYLAEIRRFEEA
ncbi:MAG: hypothetical protein AAF184_14625 [Pseudomonadota bacterium]